jgi:hypothetical protein
VIEQATTTIGKAESVVQLRRLKYFLRFFAILLALIQSAASIFWVSSEDAISYLDIADAFLRNDWKSAVNLYWSPLYPSLISVGLFISRPFPFADFVVVQAVNFLLFLAAVISFEFLLRQWIENQVNKDARPEFPLLVIPKTVLWIFGYTIFLWGSLYWLRVDSDTPDLLASVWVFLATGLLLHIRRSATSASFAALGIVAGFAYLTKAALLPVALSFLVLAFFAPAKRSVAKLLLALAMFAILTLPFIVALSQKKGSLTLGEAGKLNYVWLVNPGKYRVPDVHRQGEMPEFGLPEHPTKMIASNPPTYEFAHHEICTYPPWYDPAYWHEGVIVKFNLDRQIHVLKSNIAVYFGSFLWAICFLYLLLLWMSVDFRSAIKNVFEHYVIIVPAVIGLLLYLFATDLELVNYSLQKCTRFFAPFAMVLFLPLTSAVSLPPSDNAQKLLTGGVVIAALMICLSLTFDNLNRLSAFVHEPVNKHRAVAEELLNNGIKPGDRVAILGGDMFHIYWARLARVNIIAEIPEWQPFWALEPQAQLSLLERISQTGAKALITMPDKVMSNPPPPWKTLKETRYSIYFFAR